ncbi:MAG: GPP34 family phosphoprotein [Bacteroidales bacterium]|nr:GPP34 family phosphoprotein [Bacteroidales bacterium]
MELSITENFLLLGHHPLKGRFMISDVMMNYGLPGAFLMELSLKEKISIRDSKLIIQNRRENDRILSEVLSVMAQSGKPKKIKTWIQLLARKSRRFRRALLEQMAGKKLIYIQYNTFLGFIHYRKYYVKNNRVRSQLITELKQAILRPENLDPEIIPLIGLVEACKMHKMLTSDKKELKLLKQKTKILIKDMPVAGILDETIRQVQAAIIAGIAASTAATAAAH